MSATVKGKAYMRRLSKLWRNGTPRGIERFSLWAAVIVLASSGEQRGNLPPEIIGTF